MAPTDRCLSFDYLLAGSSEAADTAPEASPRKRSRQGSAGCAVDLFPLGKRLCSLQGAPEPPLEEPCLAPSEGGFSFPIHEGFRFPLPDTCTLVGSRYRLDEAVVGVGRYGTVRVCWDEESGERLACKTVGMGAWVGEREVESARREAEMMRRASGHENVVQLRGVHEEEGRVHLIMEECGGGDLHDLLLRRGRLGEADAAHLMAELVRGVAFCHSQGVIHRDLKPENVLLSRPIPEAVALEEVARQGPLVKLADFGLAKSLVPGQALQGTVGSPLYMAPEVAAGEYSAKADVWSLGVILYILLSGTPPFWGPTDAQVLQAVRAALVDLSSPHWAGVSPEAKSLVNRLLARDPASRPSAHRILAHPWIVQHVTPHRAVRHARVAAVESAMQPWKTDLSVPVV